MPAVLRVLPSAPLYPAAPGVPKPLNGEATSSTNRFQLTVQTSDVDQASFADEVRAGLSKSERTLPCRFFYDDAGSKIFEEICDLEEYYITRTERSILAASSGEIAGRLPDESALVELGSGSAEKTRLLIEALIEKQSSLVYTPIDISRAPLQESSMALLDDHPELNIHAICGEYEEAIAILSKRAPAPRLILWLGSSIGNLHKSEATAFLARIRKEMNPHDRMLIGVDLRKDRERLESAYDDSLGTTARFNLNLLRRVNRELDGDFELSNFGFEARYHDDTGAVASSLVSLKKQTINVAALGQDFSFREGEKIHTENSYKYSQEEIELLAKESDMTREAEWQDAEALYSLSLFAPLSV